MEPITALISAVGAGINARSSNVNSLLGMGTSIYNTYATNKANRELAEYSYGKDLEQWRREVEYNSPLNQMKRYQEAGLNPNLIYSQGNPGNSSVSSPSYKAPTLAYQYQSPRIATLFDNLNVLSAFQDLRIKDAQKNHIEAQTNNLVSENDRIVADTLLKKAQEARANYDFELAKKLEETYINMQREQLGIYQADNRIKQVEADFSEADQEFFSTFDRVFGTDNTSTLMKFLFRNNPQAANTLFGVFKAYEILNKKFGNKIDLSKLLK